MPRGPYWLPGNPPPRRWGLRSGLQRGDALALKLLVFMQGRTRRVGPVCLGTGANQPAQVLGILQTRHQPDHFAATEILHLIAQLPQIGRASSRDSMEQDGELKAVPGT